MEGLADAYEIEETAAVVAGGGYRRVALQFPDDLLPHSPHVADLLQERLGDRARVFILGDTAYNPLGVDEVAAQHLSADCVVHYGRASLVPVNSLPALFVFPKEPINVPECAQQLGAAIAEASAQKVAAHDGQSFAAVVMLVDQGYQHRLQELVDRVASCHAEQPLPQLVVAHPIAKFQQPAGKPDSGRKCASSAGCGAASGTGGEAAQCSSEQGGAPTSAVGGCGASPCCTQDTARSAEAALPSSPPPPAADARAGDQGGGGGRCSPGSGPGDASPSTSTSMAGLAWSLPRGARRADCLYVWVGPPGSSAHQVLQLTHSTCEWLSYCPEGGGGGVQRGVSEDARRLLRRRNFVVEKVRAASIVGILVGTLGSAGFRNVIDELRRLATSAGKKTYTFLMGKPTPAKMGNFPEVDAWVMVADAQGLILDSRDYLVPLATPWEAAVALTGRHIDPDDYRLELLDVLEPSFKQQPGEGCKDTEVGSASLALSNLGLDLATRGAAADRNELIARNAAEFLALKRSYKGLEAPVTGAALKAAELAVEGLSGRAAVYEGER